MRDQAIELLAPQAGGRYLDGTVGAGGHAEAILERCAPDGRLLGIDADPEALRLAADRLARFGARVVLVHGNFRDLALIARERGFVPLDGVLLDLGLSSMALERSGRGFSFQRDEPLDMRFDPSGGPTAADLVNWCSEDELVRILREYGEEPAAHRIAGQIIARRPLNRTSDLVAAVEAALGRRAAASRIHPATRTFQALRIAVNDELGALRAALAGAVEVLRPGGRLVVISFHSLEDRIVKQFIRERSGRVCVCPPDLPVCVCGRTPSLRDLTPHPLVPPPEEVERNPRARSARLRAAATL